MATSASLRRVTASCLITLLTVAGLARPAGASPAPAVPDLGLNHHDRTPATLTGGAARHTPAAGTTVAGRYLVRLKEAPVTSYAGGVAGLAATRPAAGERLAAHSTAAETYRRHLGSQRAAVLSRSGLRAEQTYTTAFNGFAARMSAAQATTLAKDPAVAAVSEVHVVTADGLTAPSALTRPAGAASSALTGPAGAPPSALVQAASPASFTQPASPSAGDISEMSPATGISGGEGVATAGVASGQPSAGHASGQPSLAHAVGQPSSAHAGGRPSAERGAGVVVGVIDTGIWPESASFAAKGGAPAGWHGTCQVGDGFPASACNGKIVGARYFADGWLSAYGALPDGEILSARDMQGHGTHTASTAAGLPVAHAMVLGRDLGPVAGVAPDARIAVYKALWGGAGTDADIIAAIDAAVADGVQVINYSIGSSWGDYAPNSPIGNAFLNAYLAGVFVAASAGNDGMSGMISNAEPWVTTVGAAVQRLNEATVRLGDGSSIVGTSMDVLPDARTKPIVFAGAAGSLEAGAQFCWGGSLDPAKVKGKLVACDFDDPYAAVAEVKAAGGAGVVLFQSSGNVRLNIIYDFPAIYLWSAEQAGRLFNYLWKHQSDGTASIRAGGNGTSVDGLPSVAGLSSYGPDQVHTGLQKPDLVADGVDVVAAVSPVGDAGRLFDAYSGTSMAAPHVAGMAAVLRAKHPRWSPGATASALRTTAADTKVTTSPLKQGSGLPKIAAAADPGLVIEPSAAELTAFAGAATPDGKEINLPSIALREYDGTKPVTVTRRLTNVGSRTESYRASVTGLPGMKVTVTPRTFVVRPGATVSVRITLRRGSATWDRYTTGALTFVGERHRVRMTVAGRPWGFTPRPYDDTGIEFGRTGGFGSGYLQPGFTGSFAGRTTGYTPVRWTDRKITTTVTGGVFSPGGEAVDGTRVVVPSGTAGLILQTSSTDQNSNFDLYVYKDGKLVDRSAAFWHSSERSVLFFPAPGVYTAYVHAAAASGPTVAYSLGVSVVPAGAHFANATLTTDPKVERGGSATVTLTPKGTLPDVEHWAYTEFRTGHDTVPGLLISSR